MSAHWKRLLESGWRQFLVTGDVYRKDEIDRSHYPVFHQTEGMVLFEDSLNIDPENELKNILTGLILHLFPSCEYRFNNDYFPFTHPSFEIEVKFNDRWLEVLGCGVVRKEILESSGINGSGWAFGLGLERLAMVLFNIPDIRLFWSNDPNFLSQFSSGKECKYIPYPALEPVTKDISFWISNSVIEGDQLEFSWKYANDFFEFVRECAGDNIEQVILFDKFYHPKKEAYSHTYRLIFTPTVEESNPAEFNENCNTIMNNMRSKIAKTFNVVLR